MDDRQNDKIANEDLMCRVTTGDKHAFETLIYRHQRPILNFIFHFMGDPAEAEDLTQEVFLSVWKSAKTYQPEAKFKTWLYRIATNLCINKQRALRIRKWLAIVLRIYDGLSYHEISQIMDRPVSSVDSLLIRAKKNLRKKLTGKK